MGFGLPAAMGVKLAFPKQEVVCVTGEGSIQMCIQELSTCMLKVLEYTSECCLLQSHKQLLAWGMQV